MRTYLSLNASYFVSTSGNDTHDGLTAATAWATLQHAYDTIQRTLDFCGFSVTVNVAAGTYAPFVANGLCVGQVGASFIFNGNVTNGWSVVVLNQVGGYAIYVASGAKITVQGMAPQSPSGFGVVVAEGVLTLGPMGWSNCGAGFIDASGNDSFIGINGGHAFVSSANGGIIAEAQAQIVTGVGALLYFEGALHFPVGFLLADECAVIDVRSATVANAATVTGPRACASTNAIIAMSGVPIPGGAAITGTGGQII